MFIPVSFCGVWNVKKQTQNTGNIQINNAVKERDRNRGSLRQRETQIDRQRQREKHTHMNRQNEKYK